MWYVFICYYNYEWGRIRVFLWVLATQMFLMPSMIIMSIAATRMYRSLVDFCSNDVYVTLPVILPIRCN
jgi:hypothetical protein